MAGGFDWDRQAKLQKVRVRGEDRGRKTDVRHFSVPKSPESVSCKIPTPNMREVWAQAKELKAIRLRDRASTGETSLKQVSKLLADDLKRLRAGGAEMLGVVARFYSEVADALRTSRDPPPLPVEMSRQAKAAPPKLRATGEPVKPLRAAGAPAGKDSSIEARPSENRLRHKGAKPPSCREIAIRAIRAAEQDSSMTAQEFAALRDRLSRLQQKEVRAEHPVWRNDRWTWREVWNRFENLARRFR